MELVQAIPTVTPYEKGILVVEDDLTLRPVLERMIQKINPDIILDWTTTAESAMNLLTKDKRRYSYEVVLADIQLSGEMTGLDLAARCYRNRIPANFVLTSGNRAFETSFPFLSKPLRMNEVKAMIGPYLVHGPQATVGALDGPAVFVSQLKNAMQGLKKKRDRSLEWMMFVLGLAFSIWIVQQLLVALMVFQYVLSLPPLPFSSH